MCAGATPVPARISRREGPTADPASTPALFVACGTEDYLIEGNERFLEVAARQGHAVETVLRPGAHTWEFWDEQIQRVLEWLPLR